MLAVSFISPTTKFSGADKSISGSTEFSSSGTTSEEISICSWLLAISSGIIASVAVISSTGPFSVGTGAAASAGATSGTKSSFVSISSSPANGVTVLSDIGTGVVSGSGCGSVGCSTSGVVSGVVSSWLLSSIF